MRGKSKPWPTKNKAVAFSELSDSVCEAIRFAYHLERKNTNRTIPWNGYNLGENELVTSFPPHESLRRKNLQYNLEDQGRDALETLVGITLQLGIEQGRRLDRTSTSQDLRIMVLELGIKRALAKFKAAEAGDSADD